MRIVALLAIAYWLATSPLTDDLDALLASAMQPQGAYGALMP